MRRHIVIDNQTHWRTADLRRIVVRVARDTLPPGALPRFAVRFNFTRPGTATHGGSSGHAPVPGYKATVSIDPRRPDRVDVAMVVAHEIAHLRGLRHADMLGNPRWYRIAHWRSIYRWALDIPLRSTRHPERNLPGAPTADDFIEVIAAEAAMKKAPTE